MSDEKTTAAAKPPAEFVHLHNHSHYSLLDGLQKVPQMLDRIKELGMDSVALTDHGTLSGAIEFYKEAAKRGLKPIIGVEIYMAPRGHTDKTAKTDANPYHLILLAENHQGYQNLMRLVSIAHLDGFYYKPRIDRELLQKYREGLIALSACASGEVGGHIRNGQLDQAEAVVRWYLDLFGPEHYFLELQDHQDQWPVQKQINDGLLELSKRTGAQLVVTADSHYTRPTDKEAHEILLCVQTGKTVTDSGRMTMEMDLFVSDPREIAKRWSGHPEAVANTAKIAARCDVTLELGGILIPRFEVPSGGSEREYLHQLTWQGLMWRYGNIAKEDVSLMNEAKARASLDKTIIERTEFELSVIGKMGYDGYFLIVADFINWGKNRGIIFGPGRGSAAGSIVSYALNVTDLDPMKYELLFERFLNPDRISMPDIDIDIQDTRREEVIAYVTEKYGQERVAQIITFGTMAARNAVRDTGRVLGMTYGEVDVIAKMIPPPIQGRHIPLAQSVKDDPELRREYQSNSRAKRLIDQAIKLEGTIRSNGVHAAGVVIAPDEIVNYTPLQRAQKGGISTQYSMNPIEELGLLKMDFLGLSNLTIIKNALRIIAKVYQHQIDITTIPLDDAKTFELFSRGDTTGVFQLESAGMKRYIRDLVPNRLDDIIAMVALYRPGPMQWIDDFIDRKHGRKRIEYFHPAMENALESTYGILVYQEQVMQIAKEMCGFTGGQADTLRKAIGKKQAATMAKMKTEFIEGAIKVSGAERALVERFWVNLEDFAAYCFNKSHAACYALIAYQTAYLKAHYPAAFMAALMTSDHDNIDRIAIEVAECQRMGIAVLAPDVNESYLEFGVVPESNHIRFGLSAVKNVGSGAIDAVLLAREEGGRFSGVEDFAKRVNAAEVNKKVWESLVKCGAMDSFGERGLLLANLDMVTAYASKAQKHALSGQIDIFGTMGAEESLPGLYLEQPTKQLGLPEKLAWEKELLGLYLSRHPLDEYDAYLRDKLTTIGSVTTASEGRSVTVGGIITTVRRITTKNNAAMAFVGLEDKTGTLELIVFPKAYEKSPQLWQPDQVVRVKGKVSTKDREGRATSEIKVMVDEATRIDYETAKRFCEQHGEVRDAGPVVSSSDPSSPMTAVAPQPNGHVPVASSQPGHLLVTLSDLSDTALLMKLKTVLNQHVGESQAFIVINGLQPRKIRLPFTVKVSPELVGQLSELVGDQSVTCV
ncbi:MAG TPA: DNA polymerase III subunit alpha [Candidatus Saccharimonadales bacterium]|nr:DNA polymerase III subunit alpha [Candidatus Saccharimonadales bacterium]